MKVKSPLLLLPLAVLALPACQGGPTWYSDVKPIVDGRCVGCHKEGGIAPFSLESYAGAKAMAQQMSIDVQARTMPPWHASADADVKYLDNPQLTQEQIDTIANWAKLGAQEGDSKAKVTPLAPVSGGIDRVDLTLGMEAPYSPSAANGDDDYRCFPLKWPYSDTRYVTGFNAVPGNNKIVHHIAVYVVPASAAADIDSWDNADPGEGYTCFGGPTGNHPSDIPIVLLSAWVPGGSGVTFSDGLGISVPPGSILVMQQHYNHGVGQSDQTALQFKVDTQVAKPAVYAPWIDIAWVLGGMNIPAGANPVKFAVIDDPRSFWKNFAPDVDFSNGFDVHSALFHMHQLGSSGKATIFHPDQSRTTFLDIPKWDFHWQREYRFQTPVSFTPGDKVELRCNFDNSPEHQPYVNGVQQQPHDTNWGEGSSDEMCVVDMLVTPR